MSTSTRILVLLGLALPVMGRTSELPQHSSASASTIAVVEGVYKHRFQNGTVNGEHYASENILEIVRVGEGDIYFRTHLEFYNGHVCDLFGRATLAGDGVFAFEEPPPLLDKSACALRLVVTKKEIQLKDPEQLCKSFCGARGSFDGTSFPRSARKPIRYMKRLMDSRQYQSTLGR